MHSRGKDEIYDMYEELDLDSFMHVDDFKDTLASGDDEMDENNGIEDITCEAEIENDDNEIKTDIDEACQSETQLSKIELFDESEGKEIVDDFDVSAWLKYDISQPLLRALKVLKFKIPTEIQDRCLPIALNSKRNIIGVAETVTKYIHFNQSF